MRSLGFLVTFLMLAWPPAAVARTWNVHEDGSGDAPTIQAGIDSAAAGDSVLVSPGTYLENIDFRGKGIVVQGGGAEVTTIDGSGRENACVLFINGESNSSVLTGFTLTGGSGYHYGSSTSFGGAIYGLDSEPTIQGNTILDNQALTAGGGVYLISGGKDRRPLVIGNQVLRNKSKNGGGLAFNAAESPVVRGNVISENETTSGDGAGIWLFTSAHGAIITDNLITNNVAGDHGGAIDAVQEVPSGTPIEIEISWNLIAGNKALWQSGVVASAGGLWLHRTSAWVHHNTIVDNRGDGPDSTSGGGIVLYRPGSPVVEKNIIAVTQSGGGIWCGDGVTPTIRNNLAWQNVGGHGVGDCAAWWQSDGNVATDPYFCDAASGNYTLAQNSPALTHEAGPLGAFHLPGCGPVSVKRTTWGRIKTLYK